MRILAISDMHGNEKALKRVLTLGKKVDLLIIAGDLTILGRQMHELLNRFNSLKKPVLMITGNHEDERQMKHICSQHKYLYFMNNKIMKIDGKLFYGYDTNGFMHTDKYFERDSRKFVKAIKKETKRITNIFSSPKTILISHAPVYGTKSDMIGKRHCGNKSVREFCIKNKINYCFCGHIHEAARTVDKLGKTIVVNPGAYGMMFEI